MVLVRHYAIWRIRTDVVKDLLFLKGGLGNQLYQLNMLRSLGSPQALKTEINTSLLQTYGTPRKCEVVPICRQLGYYVSQQSFAFAPHLVRGSISVFGRLRIHNGYFQDLKIDPVFCSVVKSSITETAPFSGSSLLHIRGGDFVLVTPDYETRVVAFVRKIIASDMPIDGYFTDDNVFAKKVLETCGHHSIPEVNLNFSSSRDIKRVFSPHSSFSSWIAFLNQAELVMPRSWEGFERPKYERVVAL